MCFLLRGLQPAPTEDCQGCWSEGRSRASLSRAHRWVCMHTKCLGKGAIQMGDTRTATFQSTDAYNTV